jgi:hypothetical protein
MKLDAHEQRRICNAAFAIRGEWEALGKRLSWKEALRLAREKLDALSEERSMVAENHLSAHGTDGHDEHGE